MPLGIPHSKFLAWSEDDRFEALAWMRRERGRCRGCGVHPDEAKDDPFAFVGHITHCKWCEAIEQEKGNIPENQRSPAYKIGVIPRSLAERMMAEDQELLP